MGREADSGRGRAPGADLLELDPEVNRYRVAAYQETLGRAA